MAAALPPLQSPIGIFPQFIAQKCENIKLRERMMSLSGDSFHIDLYPSNQPLLQVQGTTFSLSGRKTVMDMRGNALFQIRKQTFSIPSTYVSSPLSSHLLLYLAQTVSPLGNPPSWQPFR